MPAQLSVVVGIGTVTSHSAMTGASVGTTGGVTSLTTTVCVWKDTLPLPSLNIQVTTVVPCAVTGKVVNVVAVIVPVQLSVAVGAVNVTAH